MVSFLLLLPIFGVFAMAFAHSLIVRYYKSSIAPTKIFFGFIIGFIIISLGITISIIQDHTLSSIANSLISILLYFILAYCYYHFINIGEASIRLRIFAELHQGKNLTAAELSHYQHNEISYRRIERLLNSGDILLQENFYKIGKQRYLIAAKIFQFAKYALGLPTSNLKK